MQPCNNVERFNLKLTDIFLPVILDNLRQFHISSNDSDLTRRLVGIIQSLSIGAPKQQLSRTRLLVIDRTDMQRGIPRRISRIHIRAVEEQVLQVLHHARLARLVHLLPALQVLSAGGGVVVEERLGELRIGVVRDGEVEGREALAVLVVGGRAQLQEGLHRFKTLVLHGAVHGG